MRGRQSFRLHLKLWHIFAGALVFRLALAPLTSHPDVGNHIDWGVRFFEYGASKFYAPESNIWAYTWPNQPPGTILIFAFIRKIYELIFGLIWQINVSVPPFPSGIVALVDKYLYIVLLKLPAILADLGIAYLIYRFVKKYKGVKFASLGAVLFLVNPIVWYNSALWGQTDSIINFLFMLAIWFLVKKKPVLSSLSLAISVYIKISLVIFLPIFAVLFIKQRFSFKKIFVSVALPIVFFVVLTLPFSYPAEPFSWSVALYKDKVLANQLQVITANAFNIWAFLTGIKERPHGQLLGPVSFQVWGVLLFLAAYLPLLYKAWKRPSFETIVWVLSLSAFSAFMLLTNMHERYLYPLFPYFTILIVLNLSLLPLYITISGANLLNMYHLWWVPKFSFSEAIFNFSDNLFPKTLSFLGLALYLLTYYSFWQKKNIKI